MDMDSKDSTNKDTEAEAGQTKPAAASEVAEVAQVNGSKVRQLTCGYL